MQGACVVTRNGRQFDGTTFILKPEASLEAQKQIEKQNVFARDQAHVRNARVNLADTISAYGPSWHGQTGSLNFAHFRIWKA